MRHYGPTDDYLDTYFAETIPPAEQRSLNEKKITADFWAGRLATHKLLTKTALGIFATPVSFLFIERNFSIVNQIVAGSRAQMALDSIEKLVYARSALRLILMKSTRY